MVIDRFRTAPVPEIVFGEGNLARVPELVETLGRRLLLVTGRRSFPESERYEPFLDSLRSLALSFEQFAVDGEPSPDLVDAAVARHAGSGLEAVVGIGGGSVLDAAKAVAGLLPTGRSVLDHLEGVGRGVPYEGPALPFVAVPTTAGTGSEATKNAVISVGGDHGFKKSFRHESLVPRYAVVDPDLLSSCPPELIAADGMDALTQLVESYVSIHANPMAGAMVEKALKAVREALLPWFEGRGDGRETRSRMAFASLVSGIALAQTGLGAVHGLASPLGAYFPVPHGVVCGTLLAAATRANLRALRERDPGGQALRRYGRAASILLGDRAGADDPLPLPGMLDEWTERLRLPRLGEFGVREEDIPRLVAGCRGGSMKSNPIVLTDGEIAGIVRERL